MHFKWNYTPSTTEQTNAANELGEKLNMSPTLASLLIHRGITTESAAKGFSGLSYPTSLIHFL